MFVISIERTAGAPITETMNNIRMWLDHRKIETASFKPTGPAGNAGLEIGFNTEDEAELFRQEFGGVAA